VGIILKHYHQISKQKPTVTFAILEICDVSKKSKTLIKDLLNPEKQSIVTSPMQQLKEPQPNKQFPCITA
jgi:hypothetical protein